MGGSFAVARGRGVGRAAPGEKDARSPMSEKKRDYEIGRGKPPVHTRFKKGQSGNPRGPRPKNLPALLIEALNEKVTVTIDGERREITKREAVATQLVNKIDRRRFARDKDANRHTEGRREKGRCGAACRACPVHRRGRRGDGDLHHKAAAILGGGASAERHEPGSCLNDDEPRNLPLIIG
jgi:hypothetical protein